MRPGRKVGVGDDGNGLDPVLPFTVPSGVKELTIAVEDLLGRGGNMFAYRLKAKQQEPDFSVDLATPFVNVPAGRDRHGRLRDPAARLRRRAAIDYPQSARGISRRRGTRAAGIGRAAFQQ